MRIDICTSSTLFFRIEYPYQLFLSSYFPYNQITETSVENLCFPFILLTHLFPNLSFSFIVVRMFLILHVILRCLRAMEIHFPAFNKPYVLHWRLLCSHCLVCGLSCCFVPLSWQSSHFSTLFEPYRRYRKTWNTPFNYKQSWRGVMMKHRASQWNVSAPRTAWGNWRKSGKRQLCQHWRWCESIEGIRSIGVDDTVMYLCEYIRTRTWKLQCWFLMLFSSRRYTCAFEIFKMSQNSSK